MYIFETNDNGYHTFLKIRGKNSAEAIEKYKTLFGDLKNVVGIYVELIFDDIIMEG